jgi:flagellar protein FliO/FliZ
MPDLAALLRFAVALGVVLLLIAAVAWLARRFMAGGAMPYGKKRRLSLVEMLPLDGKSRLAIVRRDDVEHLVVLGPAAATVIESGFRAPSASGMNEAAAPISS